VPGGTRRAHGPGVRPDSRRRRPRRRPLVRGECHVRTRRCARCRPTSAPPPVRQTAGRGRATLVHTCLCRDKERHHDPQLASGQYRLYSRKLDLKTGKRRNLGTFDTRAQAEQHEREVQYFKHH
jgi:hypothetical protein